MQTNNTLNISAEYSRTYADIIQRGGGMKEGKNIYEKIKLKIEFRIIDVQILYV